MMRDCAHNDTDVLILVSADSDLVPPIEIIKRDYPGKTIKVFFPPKGFSNDLNNCMNGKVLKLQKHKIRFSNCVMPDTVTGDGKSFTIPTKWII